MPLDRKFTPSTKNDGIWFAHQSLDDEVYEEDLQSTTTKMLYSTFSEEAKHIPPPAPVGFQVKEASNYKRCHKFSEWDNKYALDRGVNLGQPEERKLGKALVPITERTNYTERDFLKHFSYDPVEYSFNTVYRDVYRPKRTKLPTIFRKYQRVYKEPSKGLVQLEPFKNPDAKPRIAWRTLSYTQRPEAKMNAWKLAYYPVHKQKYDMRSKPPVYDGTPRYGPDAFNKTMPKSCK